MTLPAFHVEGALVYLRNDLDGARRSVALGTRQAFHGVESGRALVKALEAAESSSKLALEATEVGFRVGVHRHLPVEFQ
jgi:outer membrane protein